MFAESENHGSLTGWGEHVIAPVTSTSPQPRPPKGGGARWGEVGSTSSGANYGRGGARWGEVMSLSCLKGLADLRVCASLAPFVTITKPMLMSASRASRLASVFF